MDKSVEKVRPWILLKREEGAQRAGYNSVEEMNRIQKEQLRQKNEKRRRREKKEAEWMPQLRRRLAKAETELKQCIQFSLQHGDRMRSTLSDISETEQVVAANSENNRKISELRQRIKQLKFMIR